MATFSSSSTFEKALDREILISERLRLTIIAALLGALFIAVLFAFAFLREWIEQFLRGKINYGAILVALGGCLAYEIIAIGAITFILRRGYRPPIIARYFNAFVEASLPALLTYLFMQVFDPAYALLLPPALMAFIFIFLATLRLDFWLCIFTGTVAAVEYFALALSVIGQPTSADVVFASLPFHAGRTALVLLSGVVAALISTRLKQQFSNSIRTVEERNKIISMFGQHVSPAVAEKLLAQPDLELDGETRHVCVMFLDIRDFTTFSEQRPPEEVVRYLNTLFEFMIDNVNKHNGIVNKFLGDGFMAIFGAPLSSGDDVRNAVRAAQEILGRVDALNDSKGIPPTRIGIGLHAGDVVTGNVGSTLRKEYTIIGDAVNLASRIEQLNKQFGSRLLVSYPVWHAIQTDTPNVEDLGLMDIRGHHAPVRVYRLA